MSLILCPDNGKVFSGPLLPVLVALTFSFYHRGDKTRDYLAQHPPFKIRMPTSGMPSSGTFSLGTLASLS